MASVLSGSHRLDFAQTAFAGSMIVPTKLLRSAAAGVVEVVDVKSGGDCVSERG